MTRCNSPSTEAPTGKTHIFLLSLHPLPKHPLHHLMHLHDLDWSSPGNTPHLRRISPIGHLETLSKPGFLNSIASLRICLGKGGFVPYEASIAEEKEPTKKAKQDDRDFFFQKVTTLFLFLVDILFASSLYISCISISWKIICSKKNYISGRTNKMKMDIIR
jgi:hypothetical protein